MSDKIEWFQEVLSLEPGSKVFLPLAKLYAEDGREEDAVTTLEMGLDRHPGFLEARMLLVQLLTTQGRDEEVHEHLDKIIAPLRDYPAVWRAWARSLPEDKRDMGVFLMLVASNLSGETIRWTDVVFEGIASLSGRLVGEPLPPPCETDRPKARPARPSFDQTFPDAEETEVSAKGAHLKTRTMANLLASQGDYQGALAIFRELAEAADTDDKRQRLEARITELEAEARGAAPAEGAPVEEVFGEDSKNRLIGVLESLAARFEARIRE